MPIATRHSALTSQELRYFREADRRRQTQGKSRAHLLRRHVKRDGSQIHLHAQNPRGRIGCERMKHVETRVLSILQSHCICTNFSTHSLSTGFCKWPQGTRTRLLSALRLVSNADANAYLSECECESEVRAPARIRLGEGFGVFGSRYRNRGAEAVVSS